MEQVLDEIIKYLADAGCTVIVALIVSSNCYEAQSYQLTKKKEIHLAGIFPIYGDKGWQGGQVSLTFAIVFNSIITRNNICASRMQYRILCQNARKNKFCAI